MDYQNLRATDGNGPAALAHIDSPRSIGATVLDVDTLDNWPDTFIVTTGLLLASGFLDPTTITEFRAHSNAGDIIIDEVLPGFTDTGNTTSQVAIIKPTGAFADHVVSFARVAHNDDGSLKDAIVAYNNLSANLIKGWIDANETWVYVSGTGTNQAVFKIVGVDVTGKYQVKDKVKFTQTQVKYGVVVKVALVGSDTQITLVMSMTSGAVDNSGMTNAVISANYYSRISGPYGFPSSPARWTIEKDSTTGRTTSSTSNASLTDTLALPIGLWKVTMDLTMQLTSSITNSLVGAAFLSSDASTVTHPRLVTHVYQREGTAAANGSGGKKHAEDLVDVLAATTFTLMGCVNSASASLAINATAEPNSIPQHNLYRAVLAYL